MISISVPGIGKIL
jgi:hypothetical protein